MKIFCLALLVLISGEVESVSYSQEWLRGEGPQAHPHEGIRLRTSDLTGWVAIGELLPPDLRSKSFQCMIRAVDDEGETLWTKLQGEDHSGLYGAAYSVGFSIIEGNGLLYAGVGLWQKQANQMMAGVVALEPRTGDVVWSTLLGQGQEGHGGVRSCIIHQNDLVCAGYVGNSEPGFQFVADEGTPTVWRLDSQSGNLLAEQMLEVEGMGQVAKIRKDASSGFVLCSTAWSYEGGEDINAVAVVKISDSLEMEWSQMYGMAGGSSQVFDMLVDNEGNYLLGGHTTVGDGVVNWDYLALKVNSQTREVEWRNTYGQPRGFDARYIHDEMYSVGLDSAGNYLLLGGSGDEYSYSEEGQGQWSGWTSDTWGSYLVVLSPGGEKLYENFYGSKDGNNAGEWLAVDTETGDIMINTDSDTAPGFGFLKLTPGSGSVY